MPASPTNHWSRRQLLAGGAATATALWLPAARAQANWPSKPLRLVVPFAPGGSSEIVARAVAAEVSKTIGQNMFVDNKPGAAGNIAMQEVAGSSDEHTLILGHIGTLAVNPFIFPKLPYDVNRDFAPVTLVAAVQNVLVVGPESKARSVADLITQGKARPGALSYASPGNGSQAARRVEKHQTTAPSLKMGRYMAMTMPPIRVPSTTMMIGSIRLDIASTASSTSCSKKSATFDSIESSAPDSSPMATIWVTMLGNRLTLVIAFVRLVPVATSP